MISADKGRLNTLYSLRDKLAREVDSAEDAKGVASISKELRATLAEIEEIEKREGTGRGVTALDELAKRRQARESKADVRVSTRKRKAK